MKKATIFLALLAVGCNGSDAPAKGDAQSGSELSGHDSSKDDSRDVEVSMEGETLSLASIDQRDDMVRDVDGERRYFLMSDGSPLQVNLNIKQDAIPASFPASFAVPADNQPNIKVDLNFFNQDRDSSRMRKRIIFSEGTIEVRAMSKNALDISFKGSGHPLGASKEMFPIEGHAKVSW